MGEAMRDEQFGYALNEDGDLVHINEAIKRKSFKHDAMYYCVNQDCKGELVVVNGQVRVRHFRHKTAICSLESYQHQLAKELIKQSINLKRSVELIYRCSECNYQVNDTIKLSPTIEYAKTECAYPNSRYIGDVAGYSADGDLEMMFEVFHSHLVDEVKAVNVDKWVEVNATQVISQHYFDDNDIVWEILRSADSQEPIVCLSCQKRKTLDALHEERKRQHKEMVQKAKQHIQNSLNTKTNVELRFPCDVCKGHNYPIRMPQSISHAVIDHRLPDSEVKLDVVGLSEDGDTKLIIMIATDYPKRTINKMKKVGSDRWLALDAGQVYRASKTGHEVEKWFVKYSAPTKKALICSFCEDKIADLTSEQQEKRIETLLSLRECLNRWGDMYAAHLDDFSTTALDDLNYICEQIEILTQNISDTDDEDQKVKKRQYVKLLYEVQSVRAIQFLMMVDTPVSRRVLRLTKKTVKKKYVNDLWMRVYKGFRGECDVDWYRIVSSLLLGISKR